MSPANPATLPADPWSPLAASRGGMPVAARWAERLWLHAVALSADDQHCQMLLGDGSTTSVPRGSIVAIPTGSPFQAGHQVLARWRNSAMFPGTISAVSSQGYTVAWHDGDVPLVVPPGSLTFLDWCRETTPVITAAPHSNLELTPPATPKPPITAGVLVAVRARGAIPIARVQSHVPGGYKVQFTDGALASIPAAEAVPIPAQHVFQAGDHVLALWRNGLMFPGTITHISSQGYTIAWHDGDTPQEVQLGTLTFLYWALEQPA
jgi:hypothetical protein